MEPLSLREFEDECRRLALAIYDFFAGGADDEVTGAANETAFAQIGLVPHMSAVARHASRRSLLGRRAAQPLLIAPTAFHRLHPDGELATARPLRRSA